MEWWIAAAMDVAQTREPLLSDQSALELASNLYQAWPDHRPADAVGLFFEVMIPLGWRPALGPMTSALH